MKDSLKPINVLIVDDSAFMRKVVHDLLESDPQINVIAHARNGQQALDIIQSESPDVITLDIEMPVMDGLTTLEHLMKTRPVPVLMLSSLTKEGSVQTIKALELGAVDFIQKPTLSFMISSSQFREDLITKVKEAVLCKIKPIDTNRILSETPLKHETQIVKPVSKQTSNNISITKIKALGNAVNDTVIAIAVSTGGPKALQSVIPLLPASLSCPVLVVQHMPPGFTRSLAERLNQLSHVNVKEAEHEEVVRKGTVYIAPGDYHMKVQIHSGQQLIILSKEKPVAGHRPSADALFQSLASIPIKEVICVVMTGMGSDGTKGIHSLKENNIVHVVAQNEESSVVYGMPKSAVLAGVVDEIIPLEKIANAIMNRIGGW